jgi:hypothetical protein
MGRFVSAQPFGKGLLEILEHIADKDRALGYRPS